jgi:serine/threonine protein phosphatase PrpC
MESSPHIACAGISHTGKLRGNNEDAMLLLPGKSTFFVADGMGGGAYGEIASRLAMEAIEQVLATEEPGKRPPTARERGLLVAEALNLASSTILEQATELGLGTMGTTAVGLILDASNRRRAIALHAGDSRAYRYRYWNLTQLTVDHSVAEAAGITNKKLMPRKYRSGVTRAIGTTEYVEIEETEVSVRRGDLFFMCSDGLTEMLSDEKLTKLFRKNSKLELPQLARVLAEAANNAGGKDNITVVLVKIL